MMMEQIHLKKIYQRQLIFQENIINEVKDAMIQFFIQSAKLLPLKSGIYATILGSLVTQSLTDQIILGLLEHLQQIAQEETSILGQTILKFLSELMNVGLLNTVSFVECLYDLQRGAENENSPFYLQILLTTFPHVLRKAMEKNQIEFKNIIQNVEVLINFLNNQEKDAHTQIFQQFLKSTYPRPYLLFKEEMTQVRQLRRVFKIPIVKRYKIWRPQQNLVVNDKQDTKTDIQIEIIRQWIYETIELFKNQQIINYILISVILKQQTIFYTLLNMIIETVPRKDQLSTVFFSGLLSHLSQRNADNIKKWNEILLNNLLINYL
ncbi:unnamed protein product [Paramecium pentaurelia]|uniref:Uncharacterized protein n=1 Tax=Paramecium pentaurelia TaxID=43138 RepID=A0A8S1TE82_9CILI|nr:unnamed protein product [Paramecium pentaurelia]